MKRITFATLKAFARRGMLMHRVVGEFNGMYDGMEYYRGDNEMPLMETTVDSLNTFKVSRNYLMPRENYEVVKQENDKNEKLTWMVSLSNCCYLVNFFVADENMAWRTANYENGNFNDGMGIAQDQMNSDMDDMGLQNEGGGRA